MVVLRSYVNGSWFTPEEQGAPLFDAVTGEEVARISSAGIDMAGALDYGRRVGGAGDPATHLPRAGKHAEVARRRLTGSSGRALPAFSPHWRDASRRRL